MAPPHNPMSADGWLGHWLGGCALPNHPTKTIGASCWHRGSSRRRTGLPTNTRFRAGSGQWGL